MLFYLDTAYRDNMTYYESVSYLARMHTIACRICSLVWKNRPKVRRKNSLVRLEKMAAHTHCKKTKINHGAENNQ